MWTQPPSEQRHDDDSSLVDVYLQHEGYPPQQEENGGEIEINRYFGN